MSAGFLLVKAGANWGVKVGQSVGNVLKKSCKRLWRGLGRSCRGRNVLKKSCKRLWGGLGRNFGAVFFDVFLEGVGLC